MTAAGSLYQMFDRFLLPALQAVWGIFGPWGIAIAGATTAVIAISKAWKDAHPSIEETNALIDDANSKLETNKQRLEEIGSLPWYERTSEIENERLAIEEENKELEKNLEYWKARAKRLDERQARRALREPLDLTDQTAYRVVSTQAYDGVSTMFGSVEEVASDLNITIGELSQRIIDGVYNLETMAATSRYTGDEIDAALISTLNTLSNALEKNGELTQDQQILYEQATEAAHKRSEANAILGNSYDEVNNALAEAEEAYRKVTIEVGNADEAIQEAKGSVEDWVVATRDVQSKLNTLILQYPELTSAVSNTNGVLSVNMSKLSDLSGVSVDTKKEIFDLVAQLNIFSNTGLDITQKVVALRQLALEAGVAISALSAGVAGGDMNRQIETLLSYGYAKTGTEAETMLLQSYATQYRSQIPEGGIGGVGGGGGGGGSQTDATLNALKKVISLRESELTLSEKQGKSAEEQIAKIKEIQAALHDEAEYLRSIGASEEDINKLSASWWDYQKKINELQEEFVKNLQEQYKIQAELLQNQVDGYEALSSIVQDYADEQIAALNDQLQALEDVNDELNGQIALEEKLDSLARARQAKVMVYKDGRFQYVEDIDEVSAAQGNLQAYQRQQEYESQRKAINDQIKVLEDYKDEWADMANAYKKESDRQLAAEQLHIDLEKANFDEMLRNAADYVQQYKALMAQVAQANTIASGATAGVSSGVDWSALWWEAQNDLTLSAAERTARQEYYHTQKALEMQDTGKQFNAVTGQWYGNGTLDARGGVSLVGEHGPELRVLNSGDGILPANITANLWRWGSISPSNFLSGVQSIGGISGIGGGNRMDVTIQSLSLPNVTNGEDFVDYVRNNLFGQVMSFVH